MELIWNLAMIHLLQNQLQTLMGDGRSIFQTWILIMSVVLEDMEWIDMQLMGERKLTSQNYKQF